MEKLEKRKPGRPRKRIPEAELNLADSSARDLKAPMTDNELKFIELHLVEHMPIDEAMISAGYGHFHERTRYQIARRITQKYESRADDRRILFRELGAGEVAICQGLLNLARNARSEQVQPGCLGGSGLLPGVEGRTDRVLPGSYPQCLQSGGGEAPGHRSQDTGQQRVAGAAAYPDHQVTMCLRPAIGSRLPDVVAGCNWRP